jgi:hypothetical protein
MNGQVVNDFPELLDRSGPLSAGSLFNAHLGIDIDS